MLERCSGTVEIVEGHILSQCRLLKCDQKLKWSSFAAGDLGLTTSTCWRWKQNNFPSSVHKKMF